MAIELFQYRQRFFYEKFAFSFRIETICEQTHGQTQLLVHVLLVLIIYFKCCFPTNTIQVITILY